MAGNLETRQDQVLGNDQLNKIDAKSITFNMENYENYTVNSDKIPPEEKMKYKELNKKYKDLYKKLQKLEKDFSRSGISKRGIRPGTHYWVETYDDLVDHAIVVDDMYGGLYTLRPYGSGLTHGFITNRPYILIDEYTGAFHEVPSGKKRYLTPKEYESKLTEIENLYEKKVKAYNDFIKKRKNRT